MIKHYKYFLNEMKKQDLSQFEVGDNVIVNGHESGVQFVNEPGILIQKRSDYSITIEFDSSINEISSGEHSGHRGFDTDVRVGTMGHRGKDGHCWCFYSNKSYYYNIILNEPEDDRFEKWEEKMNENKQHKLTFDYLYNNSPEELKNIISELKKIEQRKDKHPEGNVFDHTQVVTDRLSKYNDINLSLSGLFHDLGKLDTVNFNEEKGIFQHLGHENESLNYITAFKDWIDDMGGDYDIIYYIVENHMRMKKIDEMRKSKQRRLIEHPYFELLKKFSEQDRGGFV